MITDQGIQELSSNVDKLKDDNRKLVRDNARWKTLAQAAGVDVSAEEAAMENVRDR